MCKLPVGIHSCQMKRQLNTLLLLHVYWSLFSQLFIICFSFSVRKLNLHMASLDKEWVCLVKLKVNANVLIYSLNITAQQRQEVIIRLCNDMNDKVQFPYTTFTKQTKSSKCKHIGYNRNPKYLCTAHSTCMMGA
jgi:hypothetical protein